MAAKKKARRRPASPERKYEVKAEIENFTLVKAKSALKLEIYCREEKLGELQVGRGSLYWWGAHRQKEKRVSWGRFAQMMDELAYGRKTKADGR
ncbi:MAG: hypothetical protein WCF43_09370 [Steroidobacteraceae bacterium]